MKLYPLFLLMAALTVLSPGPGVVMTLTNALRHGFRSSLSGVLGLATGVLLVAAASATSLGVLMATSAVAFTAMKFIGAGYLVFLGIKLWRAPPLNLPLGVTQTTGFGRRFLEGVSLQLTNPKAIFFFLSVFPQFIDSSQRYAMQFTVLVLSYSGLLVLIHGLYAMFAHRARGWLNSEHGARTVNRLGGATFMLFGAVLAGAHR